jgi:NAD(P)-dependent dehydrogenase (short-subunit alcohol dehydrogenase family)
VTFARYGAYSASKFAVEAISDALRVELEEYGVAVALVQPGFCKTELFVRGTGAGTTKATDSHAAKTNVPPEVLDVYG